MTDPKDKAELCSQRPSQDEELNSAYTGQGTVEDPYVVEFGHLDPQNPMNFPTWRKWLITAVVTLSVFAVTLTSSAYSASAIEITAEFNSSSELFQAGITLFVLGFAVGPAVWAPLSELYGRQIVFILAHVFMNAFIGATAGCKNTASLLVFRFLGGMFGSSPLTNAGGVIADLFPANKRGLATSLFSTAPFMGPMLGPILGGFVTVNVGWRWVQGVCCIFIGVVLFLGIILLPETYGPVLLRRTANRLTRQTGKPHVSILDKDSGVKRSAIFAKTIQRPWVLLFREPIVFIASMYLAILYGTLYMFLPAFPIVYQEVRGWSTEIGSLAFLGLAVGMLFGLAYEVVDDNYRYQRLMSTTPESRLPPAMVGAIALPIGMFCFAWTNSPSIHWSVSIILSAPFGFGCVLVFISIIVYLLDAYTIYAASVLAAGAMLRAMLGAAFPLFTGYMFHGLGIHWASCIPAFLTVLCLPFPFVMYKYGAKIRMKCKYAHEAATMMAKMQAKNTAADEVTTRKASTERSQG